MKSWAVEQKQQRSSEDRYQAKKFGDFRYFAVFDGHGNSGGKDLHHVANHCVTFLHEYLALELKTINLNDTNLVCKTICDLFIEFDKKLKRGGIQHGSTCTMILI